MYVLQQGQIIYSEDTPVYVERSPVPFTRKTRKGVFMSSFCAKIGAKTRRAGQTNDYFDPANLQPDGMG